MIGLCRAPGRLLQIGAMVALGAMAIALPATAAQDASAAHPAHIHSGTCAALGDVVAPLTDVAAIGASSGAVGPASALPVEMSTTRVDIPMQTIIDGGHAVNIHQSAAEINAYIACGDIGGVVSDNTLVIGLGELNGSGYSGVAVLKSDGNATDVTVYLTQGAAGTGTASSAQEAAPTTAASTNEPAPATAASAAVEIKGFAFNPPTIDVPVGDSVTWTNGDNVPHTASGLDRAVLQSGAIAPGATFTQKFDAAGSFDYFCEFHPNMKGTIVVK